MVAAHVHKTSDIESSLGNQTITLLVAVCVRATGNKAMTPDSDTFAGLGHFDKDLHVLLIFDTTLTLKGSGQ